MSKNITFFDSVYILRNGCILDKNLELIDSNNYGYWNQLLKDEKYNYSLEVSREKVKQAIFKKEVIILPEKEKYINLLCFWDTYLYGHLFDTLQLLKHFEDDEFRLDDYKFLAPNRAVTDIRVNDIDLHFSIFGIKKEKVIWLNDISSKVYSVKNLYACTSTIVRPALWIYTDWLKNKYINYYPNIFKEERVSCKLFLPRFNSRNIENISDILSYAKKQKYIVLNGGEKLEEHIRYFYHSNRIVAQYGSSLKNILFCKEPIPIIEFRPSRFKKDLSFEYNSKSIFGDLYDKHEPVIIDSDENGKIFIENFERYFI